MYLEISELTLINNSNLATVVYNEGYIGFAIISLRFGDSDDNNFTYISNIIWTLLVYIAIL